MCQISMYLHWWQWIDCRMMLHFRVFWTGISPPAHCSLSDIHYPFSAHSSPTHYPLGLPWHASTSIDGNGWTVEWWCISGSFCTGISPPAHCSLSDIHYPLSAHSSPTHYLLGLPSLASTSIDGNRWTVEWWCISGSFCTGISPPAHCSLSDIHYPLSADSLPTHFLMSLTWKYLHWW